MIRLMDWRASPTTCAAIVGARHGDPFAVLGLHETAAGFVIRAFVPGAEQARGAHAGRQGRLRNSNASMRKASSKG